MKQSRGFIVLAKAMECPSATTSDLTVMNKAIFREVERNHKTKIFNSEMKLTEVELTIFEKYK